MERRNPLSLVGEIRTPRLGNLWAKINARAQQAWHLRTRAERDLDVQKDSVSIYYRIKHPVLKLFQYL